MTQAFKYEVTRVILNFPNTFDLDFLPLGLKGFCCLFLESPLYPRLASNVLCVGERNLDPLNVGILGIHALPYLLYFVLALECRVSFVTTKMVLAQRAGATALFKTRLPGASAAGQSTRGCSVFRLMKSLMMTLACTMCREPGAEWGKALQPLSAVLNS